MAELIERLLEEKSRGTACEMLFTQWLLARDFVPKVQSTIVRTFPHYSLHDASHSRTILNCIVRVMGEKAIGSLGPVDLWLLLTSAYYHDLGMTSSGADIEKVLANDEFRLFVRNCQDDESHPLNPFASVFEIRKDGIFYKDVTLSGSNYDGAHYLIADYIRKIHAEKSEETLLADESFHLPGSPIPERLLELLGRICRAHTESFEKVMMLPKSEVGMGLDDCHPRFIACMLRVGDLLDLDNNRFSDVLLKTLPVIPKDSLLHKKKHLSVKHLRIDTERIEVTSRTDSYDVADMTNRWLEMISYEFGRQRDRWQDIVPPDFMGYLPAIGELKVDLIGYDTIDGKKRPGFEIDTSKAIELLQGAGLYSSPAQCMRELLQNAVDATFLSIFQENSLDNPQELETVDGFMQLCKQKRIDVSIDKIGIEGKDVIWHVCIEDRGIGMDKADLGFLVRTGSKNREKAQLVEQMPEYMRPSGTFGIGFQSVFLVADKVFIRSRKRDSSDEIIAELYNPSGPREGAVLVKTQAAVMPHGTCLEFDFKSDKDLDHWTVSSGQLFSQYTVYSYDFVVDKTLDLDTARLLDEIALFCRTSPIPVHVSLDGNPLSLAMEEGHQFDYYSALEGLQLSVLPHRYQTQVYYRNQIVSTPRIRLPFVSVSVNLLSGNANKLLTLNRNELQYQARGVVRARIESALAALLKSAREPIPAEARPFVSMFLQTRFRDRVDEYPMLKDEWKEFRFAPSLHDSPENHVWEYSFGDIVHLSENKPVVWIHGKNDMDSGVDVQDHLVVIRIPPSEYEEFEFLKGKIWESHPYLSNSIKEFVPGQNGMLFSMNPVDPVIDWVGWLKMYFHHADSGRTLMPCNAAFHALRLREDVSFSFAYDRTFGVRNEYPLMICPYVRVIEPGHWHPRTKGLKWDDADGDLYSIAFENRANPSVTIEEIKEAYSQFRLLLDPFIEEVNASETKNN